MSELGESQVNPTNPPAILIYNEAEEEYIPTAEDNARNERNARREASIHDIVHIAYPDRNSILFEQYSEQDPAGINDALQRDFATRLRNYNYAREAVIERSVRSNISDEDLADYVNTTLAISDSLSPDDIELAATFAADLATIPESVEKAEYYATLAKAWREKFLQGENNEVQKQRGRDFIRLLRETSGTNLVPRPEERPTEEIELLFNAFEEAYQFKYSLPENILTKHDLENLMLWIHNIGLNSHDPDQVRKMLTLARGVVSLPDKTNLGKFLDITGRYGSHHMLTDTAILGFQNKLLPLIQHDSSVIDILSARNSFGMHRGDYGIADFFLEAFTREVTPVNINELLMIMRDVPTTSVARFEQNRTDGGSLVRGHVSFSYLKENIHDQIPGTHELIAAMVAYYENPNPETAAAIINHPNLVNFKDADPHPFLNLSDYDRDIEETVLMPSGERVTKMVKTIDILRRLETNTTAEIEEAPITADEELNKLLKSVEESKKRDVASHSALHEAMKYTNKKLIELMESQEIGLEPNFVRALSWLEHEAYKVLQNLAYEDQVGAYTTNWFHEILRFEELTASERSFDPVDFDTFIARISYTQDYQKAYALILERVFGKNLAALASKYKKMGKKHWEEALQSGNIAREIQLLAGTTKTPERPMYQRDIQARLEGRIYGGDESS